MKTHEKRIKSLNGLSKNDFLYKSGMLLTESINDPATTAKEHDELFGIFQQRLEKLFPNPSESDTSIIKIICWTKHSKKDLNEKKQTLREQLQSQITTGDIWDADGMLSPETLWGMICHFTPELKGKYNLDSPYNGEEDSTLSSAVVWTSANLAMHSKKTAHLRHLCVK